MKTHPFVERLRSERKLREISREDVAEAIGVHLNTLSRWERGDREPGIIHLHRWAEFLGMKLTLTIKKD